jgi:hypothetical protein
MYLIWFGVDICGIQVICMTDTLIHRGSAYCWFLYYLLWLGKGSFMKICGTEGWHHDYKNNYIHNNYYLNYACDQNEWPTVTSEQLWICILRLPIT